MKNNAIITLADSNYFEMLEELVDSINKHPESKNISICVLDAGLTLDQVSIIRNKVLCSPNLVPMHHNLSKDIF